MAKHHTKRDTCRLCGSRELKLAVPITPTPVADAYVPKEKLGEAQDCYPLDMYQCSTCGHIQLRDVVAKEVIFGDYLYFSGNSPGLVKHFKEYADSVILKVRPKPGDLVIDVGSNDGTFLKFFKEQGMRVLGIDPADYVAKAANDAGIETLVEFLTGKLAKKIRKDYGAARIVAANNVFAHNDDMAGMADSIRAMLADDGVFVFEVSYVMDVIDKMLLGTIFHEHVCYHSVRPLAVFLQRHGMELVDIERVSIQGGSLICTAQPAGGPRKAAPIVAELIALEEKRGLYDGTMLSGFSRRIEEARRAVGDLIRDLKAKGKRIVGFGAARGGTLIIYHFGLGDVLEYIVDDSPDKQGLHSPGHHIPVFPTSRLYEDKPDCIFILAWVHAKPIIRNHEKFMAQGGRFIISFPELQVVDRDTKPFWKA